MNDDDDIDPELVRVAAEWLVERFREQLEWDSTDLRKAAREANISMAAMYGARELLALPTAKKESRAVWVWWVPENWLPLHHATGEEFPC